MVGSLGDVWSGPALANPDNAEHPGWRKTLLLLQFPWVQDGLQAGRFVYRTSLLYVPLILLDGSTLKLYQVEGIGVVNGKTRLLAWAPPFAETNTDGTIARPSELWRHAYYVDVDDNGTVELTLIEVAPDSTVDRLTNPRPPVPE